MVHPKQTAVTPEQITATYEYVKAQPGYQRDGGLDEHGGHEIFIGTRSIGFVPWAPGTGLTTSLIPALEFLGIDGPTLCDDRAREAIVDDQLAITQAELDQITETWLWDDRMARGELEQYRGFASR